MRCHYCLAIAPASWVLTTLCVVQNPFLEIDVVKNVVSPPLPQVTIKSLALLGIVGESVTCRAARVAGRKVRRCW